MRKMNSILLNIQEIDITEMSDIVFLDFGKIKKIGIFYLPFVDLHFGAFGSFCIVN